MINEDIIIFRGDWTKQGGFRAIHSKRKTVPEDASWPLPNPDLERDGPGDYYDQGFKVILSKSVISTTM